MDNRHTPGPWMIATSCSWRRIVSLHRDHANVCVPITQSDGHPDMHFRNGGENGPDARLIAAAPDLYEALVLVTGALVDVAPEMQEVIQAGQAAIRKVEVWTNG